MIVNHNLNAMNAHRQLGINATNLAKNTEKLSSGQRINRAADDAAGLAISETMRNQIKGLSQASRNSQDGISLIQTAEGALQETHEMLKRMRELTVQGSNGTYSSTDREKIAQELRQLTQEINDITDRTEFNGKKLLNGSLSVDTGQTMLLQVGANQSQVIDFNIKAMTIDSLAGLQNVSMTIVGLMSGTANQVSQASSAAAISYIDKAIKAVSNERAKLGSVQNRLEHTIKNLNVAAENLQASEARIRDTDMAKEMMEFTKTNVLNQAAQSMISQANQLPNQVLSLLR
jgi:flagellin